MTISTSGEKWKLCKLVCEKIAILTDNIYRMETSPVASRWSLASDSTVMDEPECEIVLPSNNLRL